MTKYANIETNWGAPYPGHACAVCGAECPYCAASAGEADRPKHNADCGSVHEHATAEGGDARKGDA
jgi:hypothetical protein